MAEGYSGGCLLSATHRTRPEREHLLGVETGGRRWGTSGRDGKDDDFGAAVAAAVGAVGVAAAAAAVGGRGYSPWLSAGSGPGRQGGNEQQIWPTHPGMYV